MKMGLLGCYNACIGGLLVKIWSQGVKWGFEGKWVCQMDFGKN